MAIFDFLFYRIFRIVSYLIKSEKDAKWSAFLYFNVYVVAAIISLTSLIGLIGDNFWSQMLKTSPMVFVFFFGILSPIVFGLRYYRAIGLEDIEHRFKKMNPNLQKTVLIITLIFLVGLPISVFYLYRLFVFSHL